VISGPFLLVEMHVAANYLKDAWALD